MCVPERSSRIMGRNGAPSRLKRTKVYGRNFEKIIKEKGKKGVVS